MRYSTPASLLAFAAFVLANEAASDVISLTAANFESTVEAEPLLLVEFFAPWCGHCKALAPHYEEAATALKEKNIKLAKVDCVDEADLCQSKGIQGYPTLKVYRKGEATDYTGPRKTDGIISYMIKQSLPAVSEVTAENHEEFTKSDKIVAIAYLATSTDAPAAEFSATANSHRDDYLFGLTTDKAAIEAAGVTPPTVVVYRSFDEPKSEYPYPISSLTKKDLEEWVKELAIPILDEVNGENYAIYAGSPKPLAYLFIDPSLDDKEDHIAALKPVAAKYKSKMNFVWIDAVKFGDHAKALNLAEAKWPAFVIQDLVKQLKYPFDQSKDVSADGAADWVEQYLDGKLQPQLKSQPIPETQDEPVFTLVGKNFEETVFDDSKDVFVEFYASWCGHCKRLKPIWDNLGEKYAAIKDRLVIAKMEAQENDLPPSIPFRISGFPTLKFKPAGSRDFIDYEGDRSFESLVSFVEEHAKNSLDLPVAEESAQVPLEAGNVTGGETASHDEL
ncbi:Protein disulfide-isomerase [Psilocybe cubensis]|uniref:Protein disulfide-isomerase n=2 Tax=Psilocybe cubensis TaxID=181762 RepID=A0A8H7Y175_PSICU|nr:Protein disulfide-isomerase [Psilocybe cubensis]KAH9482699.1 Protein disulfide-isomerase [Psilocybe cubensis]